MVKGTLLLISRAKLGDTDFDEEMFLCYVEVFKNTLTIGEIESTYNTAKLLSAQSASGPRMIDLLCKHGNDTLSRG